MHFLRNPSRESLHHMTEPVRTCAHSRTPRRRRPVSGAKVAMALACNALGSGLLPTQAQAQQFNFTATPGLNGTQVELATAMDNACNALEGAPAPSAGRTDLFATCNALGGADVNAARNDLLVLAPD